MHLPVVLVVVLGAQGAFITHADRSLHGGSNDQRQKSKERNGVWDKLDDWILQDFAILKVNNIELYKYILHKYIMGSDTYY